VASWYHHLCQFVNGRQPRIFYHDQGAGALTTASGRVVHFGSEIGPGMTILTIWLLAAEKTRRQDGRERAWPWCGGVRVARPQKSRLRRVGEVCCSNFGVGSFSLAFSVGSGGGGGSLAVLWLSVVMGYTKTLMRSCLPFLSQGKLPFLDWVFRPKTGPKGVTADFHLH